jgi:hypothetical protein
MDAGEGRRSPMTKNGKARMLENFAVEYVEYINCGVVYRVIRSAAMKIYPIEEWDALSYREDTESLPTKSS